MKAQVPNKKIAVIGRIDPGETLFDGQTVKTRTIVATLEQQYGEDRLLRVDTLNYQRRAPRVLIDLAVALCKSQDIVVLLSTNGRRFFFPILYLATRIFKKRVYHNLIGGSLSENLNQFPRWVTYLNSFQVNWVESKSLVDDLQDRGIMNAEFLPNFKFLKPLEEQDLTLNDSQPIRFSTFSRVAEEKGITEAILATNRLNLSSTYPKCELHVYGPIDPAFEQEFSELLRKYPHVSYCGTVSPNESVEVLRSYFALLFPTKWRGEGMPGTIIDALSAGLPIIASRWPFYNDLLADTVTGFSYDFDDTEALFPTITLLFSEGIDQLTMKSNCLRYAKKFTPEVAIKQITDRLQS